MALIRNSVSHPQRITELARRLASEINAPTEGRQPIILENSVAQTGTFHVTVVWDDWNDLPLQARSRVILDAYEAVDPAKSGRIVIAMGLTASEAASTGLLPYVIVTTLRQSDEATRARAAEAMRAEGAIEGPSGLELRFRTSDEASAAFHRLEGRVPGVWALVHETRAA